MILAGYDSVVLTDRSAGSAVTLVPERGAIVASFVVAGRELLYLDESTLTEPSKNVRGGIPVLFPSPGKLQNDRWSYGGLTGSMKQHGFARTQPWKVVNRSDAEATLTFAADETTLVQYPWRFEAQLQFELQGTQLRMVMTLRNDDLTSMPFALGFHPYFYVNDKSKVRIPSNATRAFDNVVKRIESFDGFDLTQPEVDLHLLDHDSREATLQFDDGARIVVRASEEFSLWVVWSLLAKEFVCLEPWTAPGNALNSADRLLILAPGESRSLWVEIELA